MSGPQGRPFRTTRSASGPARREGGLKGRTRPRTTPRRFPAMSRRPYPLGSEVPHGTGPSSGLLEEDRCARFLAERVGHSSQAAARRPFPFALERQAGHVAGKSALDPACQPVAESGGRGVRHRGDGKVLASGGRPFHSSTSFREGARDLGILCNKGRELPVGDFRLPKVEGIHSTGWRRTGRWSCPESRGCRLFPSSACPREWTEMRCQRRQAISLRRLLD